MRTITSSNSNWPVKLDHPDDWEPRETFQANGASFFLRGPLKADAVLFPSITVEARPGTVSNLKQLSHEWVDRRLLIRTFHVIAHRETTLAGMPALELDGAYDMPHPPYARKPKMVAVRERVILALDEGKVYEICYRAPQDDFDTDLPIFEAVAASFSLQ